MIARLVTIQIPPDRLDGGLAQSRPVVAEVLKMDGCKGHYLLADCKAGKVVSLTLWESEDKLRASEAVLNQRAEREETKAGATADTREVFEVID
jgi:heme-degrading monooxygenase HmoA